MHIHRHCARWRINSEAKFLLEGAESPIKGHVRDISFKGMCLALTSALPKDTLIRMDVYLDAGLLCSAEVWVVWHKVISDCQCYGVYFSKIRDTDKEQMYQFICRNFPAQVQNARWNQDAGLVTAKGGGDMEDRRIFQRFEVNFPLSFLDVSHGREGAAQTIDVSAKGIGMTTENSLEPRTPLELWLRIPDHGEPLYTRGYVMWSRMVESRQYQVGVNLEKADLMGLSRVMRLE